MADTPISSLPPRTNAADIDDSDLLEEVDLDAIPAERSKRITYAILRDWIQLWLPTWLGGQDHATLANRDAADSHPIAAVTGLQGELDGKAPTVHGHVIGDVTGLQPALDSKSNVGHGHAISDVAGLQPALDGKADIAHGHAVFDAASDGFAPAAPAPTMTRFLRDDATWQEVVVPPGELQLRDYTQASHGLVAPAPVFWDGAAWKLAQADQDTTLATHMLVSTPDGDTLSIATIGYFDGFTGLTPGSVYYTSAAAAGLLTTVEPNLSNPVMIAHSTTAGHIFPYRAVDLSEHAEGDMLKSVYDPDDNGIVESSRTIADQITAGAPVTVGDPLTVFGGPADQSTETWAFGIAIETVGAGPVRVQREGFMDMDLTGFATGDEVYLGAGGGISASQTEGYRQFLGLTVVGGASGTLYADVRRPEQIIQGRFDGAAWGADELMLGLDPVTWTEIQAPLTLDPGSVNVELGATPGQLRIKYPAGQIPAKLTALFHGMVSIALPTANQEIELGVMIDGAIVTSDITILAGIGGNQTTGMIIPMTFASSGEITDDTHVSLALRSTDGTATVDRVSMEVTGFEPAEAQQVASIPPGTDHNSLSGRSNAGAHPGTSITYSRGGDLDTALAALEDSQGAPDHANVTNRSHADAHPQSSITGLVAALAAKSDTGHTHVHNTLTDRTAADAHPTSAITGLDTALAGKANITHTHVIDDVTGLQAALDAKSDVGHNHTIEDLAANSLNTAFVFAPDGVGGVQARAETGGTGVPEAPLGGGSYVRRGSDTSWQLGYTQVEADAAFEATGAVAGHESTYDHTAFLSDNASSTIALDTGYPGTARSVASGGTFTPRPSEGQLVDMTGVTATTIADAPEQGDVIVMIPEAVLITLDAAYVGDGGAGTGIGTPPTGRAGRLQITRVGATRQAVWV